MMITATQLQRIMPLLGPGRAVMFEKPLDAAMTNFAINTVNRQACFIGQLAVESGQFAKLEENLSYSAKRLVEVWPKRFPTLAGAQLYARNPEKLANKTYANRMGNGDEASGDGWRYRGAGLIQLTGKENHTDCAKYFMLQFRELGDWLRTPEGACLSAGWYWRTRNLNKYADLQDIATLTESVNGGLHGIRERRGFTTIAKLVILND